MKRKTFIQTSLLGITSAMIEKGKKIHSSITGSTSPKIFKKGEGQVYNVWGDLQTHKLTGKDTDGKFFEWYSDVAPGVGIPPHFHTKEDEVFRILQGEVEFMVDGEKVIATAGDLVYAPKTVPHAWTAIGTEPIKMIVSVYPAGLEHMFEWMAGLPPGPPTEAAISTMRDEYGIHFL